uniref:Uncharacterized protein n=1 Tax=Anguilla anguilla TaxID=7936 RepID=A0A0E9RY23_ANGAN
MTAVLLLSGKWLLAVCVCARERVRKAVK